MILTALVMAMAWPGEYRATHPGYFRITTEALTPRHWSSNEAYPPAEFMCRDQQLQIYGYGSPVPTEFPSYLRVNGHEVEGPNLELLLRDLSRRPADYTLIGNCDPDTGSIRLDFHIYQHTPEGVLSLMGRAHIEGGRLVRYDGLKEGGIFVT